MVPGLFANDYFANSGTGGHYTLLDDVRVYDRILSSTEIDDIYNGDL